MKNDTDPTASESDPKPWHYDIYYEHTVCVTVLGIRPPGLHGSALRLILLLDLGFANDKWIWIQRSKLEKKLLYKFPIKSTKTFLNE